MPMKYSPPKPKILPAFMFLVGLNASLAFAQIQGIAKGRPERPSTGSVPIVQQIKSSEQSGQKVAESEATPRTSVPQTVPPQQSQLAKEAVLKESRFGDFRIAAKIPGDWNSTDEADSIRRAAIALAGDGKTVPPVFAFSKGNEAVVYGILKEMPVGVIFPAEMLPFKVEDFPSAWQIGKDSFQNGILTLKGGPRVDYTVTTIKSKGDGLLFDPKSPGNTYGAWVAIPLTYKNAKGFHSIIIEFAYRASSSAQEDANYILGQIIESFSMQTGTLLSFDDYRKAVSTTSLDNKPPETSRAANSTSGVESPISESKASNSQWRDIVSPSTSKSSDEIGPFKIEFVYNPRTSSARIVNFQITNDSASK